MRALQRFCASINETREPEKMTSSELDKLLSKFFKDVKKENGEEYEPSSLTSFQRSFQRYFTEKKLPFNIFEDEEFSRCRQVLAAKRKSLVQSGLGNKPNVARELTEEEQISSLKLASLETTILWSWRGPFGGSFHCILVFGPEMNRENCAGGMLYCKKILKQVESFLFGERREGQKPTKETVKVAIKDLSRPSCSQLAILDVR